MTRHSAPSAESEIKPASLVELLRWRADSLPERTAYCFLADGEAEESRITYAELQSRAQAIAAQLQRAGAEGERALLVYAAGLDYVAAFFGCLYAGVVAVPAFPPRLNRNAQRLEAMAEDAGASFALTVSTLSQRLEATTAQLPRLARLRWLSTDTVSETLADEWREPRLNGESLAYLQYTSGSTSTPKGVMITHANVLANSEYIRRGFAHTPESVALTWLPHFHDMGLVDGIIQPLYSGFKAILMSPASFLQRPLRWLEAVTSHRVTHTGGPNFAYDLCVRRTNPEQRAALDLSSWSVAYNGAEPVRQETLRRFAEAFDLCGFRPSAFYPAYGLAEATLKVTGGRRGEGARVCAVDAAELERRRPVGHLGVGGSLGRPADGVRVRTAPRLRRRIRDGASPWRHAAGHGP